MENKHAAPLMCGGATVFSCLQTHDVKPTERVGIIGVGGLGHLAIQFAAKRGCEVVVFSGSDRKKEEAFELGAKEFHAIKGLDSLEGLCKPIDSLLITTSALPSYNLYVPLLVPEGKIFPISVSPTGDVAVSAQAFVQKGVKVLGCLVATRSVHQEMLDFATLHGIKPWINEFPMTKDGIDEAFDALGKGKMRYRGVLVAQ